MFSKLVFYLMTLLIIVPCNFGRQYYSDSTNKHEHLQRHITNTTTLVSKPRKAYLSGIKLQQGCTNRDISISQSKDETPGIPKFIVEIANTCVDSNCAPSNIHFHCGWFASARLVNPKLFKRLAYDDCLVNGGNPLKTGQVIRFTYSNTFKYPLAFKSVKFC